VGNIAPEQSDYNQIVKGGGHGNYRVIVLAPNSAQEMCDLTMEAFDIADKYRNPVVVLTDGFVGQMMEPVELPVAISKLPQKTWAVDGTAKTARNLISSIELEPDDLEKHNIKLQKKYKMITEKEVKFEELYTEDAEIILIGYGIVSRVLQSVVDEARSERLPVGLLRPITLFPFPTKKIKELSKTAKMFFISEMSNGQMVDDVRLALEGKRPVKFFGHMGGVAPTTQEILEKIKVVFSEIEKQRIS